jgi:predicted cupin superfamily sugar epimerase
VSPSPSDRVLPDPSAARWIRSLGLKPHPEGGYFAESYRSAGSVVHEALPAGFAGDRNFSTAIYFLLEDPAVSRLHRIQSDEVWHHYDGGALEIVSAGPDGRLTRQLLGKNSAVGEMPQQVVPAGHWFGARVIEPGGYALVGCTVAPGFDFADFELADKKKLPPELLALSGSLQNFLA